MPDTQMLDKLKRRAMTKQEIMSFINDNPEFFLATCEGNEPRVRGMRLYQANDEGIFFNTNKDKSLHKQLMNNPSVEMCFFDGDDTQVRIRGKVQLTEDKRCKEQMCRKNPEMRTFISDGKIAIYQLTEAKVKVWKMDTDYIPRLMKNIELESIWMAMYMGDEGNIES